MEIWDVYDIDRIKTGETACRGEKMMPGQYHMVVHVCIFGTDGRMLIQQRCMEKKSWAGLWDVSVGGSALTGESSRDAAEREVFEELGIKICLEGVRPNLTVNFSPGFDDVYLLVGDVDENSLVLQKEEVADARFATKEEIIQMIRDGSFIPCPESYISYLFAMKDINGIKGAIK